MADLHTYSVQESLNTTVGGTWTVATVGTAGSSADVNNTTHKLLASNSGTIGVHSAVEIHFNFPIGPDFDEYMDYVYEKTYIMNLRLAKLLNLRDRPPTKKELVIYLRNQECQERTNPTMKNCNGEIDSFAKLELGKGWSIVAILNLLTEFFSN